MAEEEISQEDKLLNVIQGENEQSDASSSSNSSKRKLKIAKKMPDLSSESTPDSKGSRNGDIGSIGVESVAPMKKIEGARSGLTLVNGTLVAAISLILLFTGLEIWGSIQQIVTDDVSREINQCYMGTDEGHNATDQNTNTVNQFYDIAALKATFEEKSIVNVPGMGLIVDDDKDSGNIAKPRISSWQKYVKENLKLLGLSKVDEDMEAVVSDQSKMYYLRVNQELVIEKTTIKITRVGSDGVDMSDGVKTINVK